MFLGPQLLDFTAGLVASKVAGDELRRKAEILHQAAGDIFKLAVQQAQARRTVSHST